MNLSAMTLAELAEMQAALALIHKGMAILSGLPVNTDEAMLSVDLTPGEVVIVTTHFTMPQAMRFGAVPEIVVDVEDRPAPVGPWTEFWAGRGTCSGIENAERAPGDSHRDQAETGASPEPAGAAGAAVGGGDGDCPAAPAESTEAVATGAGDAGDGPILGPFSPVEKAEIQKLHAKGLSNRQIAEQMNRRVQSVGLYLASVKQIKDIPAGQPAKPAAAGTVPAAPAAPASAPVSRGTDGAGPDARGRMAKAPPMQAKPEPAAPVAGGAAPVPAAQTPRQREIGAVLNALGYRAPFDAELDLEIAEGFARGMRADMLALDLDLDSKELVGRYKAITASIRDDRGHMSIDDQALMIKELRRRVAEARARAA